MKIFVTGTRGIPDIPGGVESHCQQLYPLIAARGHQIRISRRSIYSHADSTSGIKHWQGIELMDLPTPKQKSLEAIIHTLKSVFAAKQWGADIIHIHAVGPALLAPIARLSGLKVVFTHHGPDYDRDKWGKLAKWALRLGEKAGCLFAHEVIVISRVIQSLIKQHYHRDSHLIYNGVPIPQIATQTDYLDQLGLEKNQYFLAVARFVPEKGLHDLIQAYNQMKTDKKLVLAGDADHEDTYSRQLKKMAQENPDIVLTGYITGAPLQQLFSFANVFVLPSYHEGLPIALLEALSYGITPLVSDIPANREVDLEPQYYFQCKNINDLQNRLEQLSLPPRDQEQWQKARQKRIELVKQKYDWADIADQTIAVYNRIQAYS